MYLGSI